MKTRKAGASKKRTKQDAARADKRGFKAATPRPATPRRSAPEPAFVRRLRPGTHSVIGVTLFFVFLGAAVWVGRLPVFIPAIYAAGSIVALVAYGRDKSAAQEGAWRTPEASLHLIGLIGGWPGAWLAQQWFRHKSAKIEFRRVYWATVVLNCGVLVWLLSPQGASVLKLLAAR